MEKYGTKRNKTSENRSKISDAAEASLRKFAEKLMDVTKRFYIGPIVQMVSLLPKDELANLAESLVALTSLKRRVSHEMETVGGAIDVAVISKSDGFVWVKRKHYFDGKLNPQFRELYYR